MDDFYFNKLKSVLSDIESYARYGAVFYDFESKTRPLFGKGFCRLCASCVESSKTFGNCIQNAKEASYQSWLRGEAYVFKCWLGLYGIILPVCAHKTKDRISGAIEIGGLFPRGAFQSSIHQIISTLNKIDPSGKMSSLLSALQGIEEMPQMDFKTCGDFIKEALCSSGLLDAENFNINAEIWQQQNRIHGRSEEFKSISMDKERLLCFLALEIAKTLEKPSGKSFEKKLDEFLAALNSWSDNDIQLSKAAMIAASSIIRMHKTKNISAENSGLLKTNFAVEIENLSKIENIEQMILKFKKLISSESDHLKPAKTETLKKVIKFIENNFNKNIKAEETANFAGASISTIMHRIKKETGMTFSEYLNATRIKEAKRLLAYTDLNIGEVADRCGFSDQSYFSKVFFKHISITPREFRNMLFNRKKIGLNSF